MTTIYREIRVRPVIRYVVTDYLDDGERRRGTVTLGEFASVDAANRVGAALSYEARLRDGAEAKFEAAPALTIDAIRGPGSPHPSVRYELRYA